MGHVILVHVLLRRLSKGTPSTARGRELAWGPALAAAHGVEEACGKPAGERSMEALGAPLIHDI